MNFALEGKQRMDNMMEMGFARLLVPKRRWT